MPPWSAEPGLGPVQCPRCRRWLRPAWLSGHRQIFHRESRQRLLEEIEDLVLEFGHSLPKEDALRLRPASTERMSEPVLLQWKLYLEERQQSAR